MKTDKIAEVLKKAMKAEEAKKAPPIIRSHRERNMIQEAIDMGSHNAGEIFKDTDR